MAEKNSSSGLAWPGERCKSERCDSHRSVVGFEVPQDVWDRVVKGRYNVLCLNCFDTLAQQEGVPYHIDQKDLYPVSWSDWQDT